jgi:hypothetical protein
VLGVPLGLSGSMAYLVGAPISAVYVSFKISFFSQSRCVVFSWKAVLARTQQIVGFIFLFSAEYFLLIHLEKIVMDDKST